MHARACRPRDAVLQQKVKAALAGKTGALLPSVVSWLPRSGREPNVPFFLLLRHTPRSLATASRALRRLPCKHGQCFPSGLARGAVFSHADCVLRST